MWHFNLNRRVFSHKPTQTPTNTQSGTRFRAECGRMQSRKGALLSIVMKGRLACTGHTQRPLSKQGLACSSSSGISRLCKEFVNSCNQHTSPCVTRSDLSCFTDEQTIFDVDMCGPPHPVPPPAVYLNLGAVCLVGSHGVCVWGVHFSFVIVFLLLSEVAGEVDPPDMQYK